jgi:hypothetical protein
MHNLLLALSQLIMRNLHVDADKRTRKGNPRGMFAIKYIIHTLKCIVPLDFVASSFDE